MDDCIKEALLYLLEHTPKDACDAEGKDPDCLCADCELRRRLAYHVEIQDDLDYDPKDT